MSNISNNSHPSVIDFSINETFRVEKTITDSTLNEYRPISNYDGSNHGNSYTQHANDKSNTLPNHHNEDKCEITVYQTELNEKACWKRGTTLIIGDSMIYGLDEARLRNCKVRVYPGASIEDMYYNLVPLLRKKPTNIIFHAGANNAVNPLI